MSVGELQAQAEIVRLTEQRDALLEACEALLQAGESGMMSDWYPARAKARAAIAKADAEEPYLPWVV